jgi:hypothetical protein
MSEKLHLRSLMSGLINRQCALVVKRFYPDYLFPLRAGTPRDSEPEMFINLKLDLNRIQLPDYRVKSKVKFKKLRHEIITAHNNS